MGSSLFLLPLPLAGEGWGGGGAASYTVCVERVSPTRIASSDAIRPPPQTGEVKRRGTGCLLGGLALRAGEHAFEPAADDRFRLAHDTGDELGAARDVMD
jgi:hypothetical protein